MATKQTTVRAPGGDVVVTIKPGTPEMENYLSAGYGGMTLEEANAIIGDWEKDHKTWDIAEVRKARAFIAAYNATPEPISTRKAWRLTPHPDRR